MRYLVREYFTAVALALGSTPGERILAAWAGDGTCKPFSSVKSGCLQHRLIVVKRDDVSGASTGHAQGSLDAPVPGGVTVNTAGLENI